MESFQFNKSNLCIQSNNTELPVKVFDADNSNDFGIIKTMSVKLTPEELCIKEKINDLLKDLNQYTQNNNYENDTSVKILCDNLSIVYNKFGGNHGNIQSYNNYIPIIRPPKLKRYDYRAHILVPLEESYNEQNEYNK